MPSEQRMRLQLYFLINSPYSSNEYEARAKTLLTDTRRPWVQLFSHAPYELLEPEPYGKQLEDLVTLT